MADSTDNGQQAESTLDEDLKAAWEASQEVEEQEFEGEESLEDEASTPPREEGDESEASEEDAESEDQEEESEAESEESTATVEPPQDWPQDWADKFRQLDDNGRQVLLEAYRNQQADYTRKTQEVAELRKAIPDDVREQLDLNGISEGQYVKQLAAADKYLKNSPAEGLKWLAKQYNVDLESLTGEEDEFSDPQVSQLKQEIESLKSQLNQQNQQAEQQQTDQTQQQIQSFAQETDEQGNLKHPDFERLRPAMAGLIQTGYAQDLESAYEQAKWADPEVRKRLLAEQQPSGDGQRRKKKASKAKKAATPSGGSSTSGSEEPLDLRGELEKRFDENA